VCMYVCVSLFFSIYIYLSLSIYLYKGIDVSVKVCHIYFSHLFSYLPVK
jgi:hypothetical protein